MREDYRSDVPEGSFDPLGGYGPHVLALRDRIDLEPILGVVDGCVYNGPQRFSWRGLLE